MTVRRPTSVSSPPCSCRCFNSSVAMRLSWVLVDDAQWLDTSSQVVFGYAARRLTGRVGVLASTRIR